MNPRVFNRTCPAVIVVGSALAGQPNALNSDQQSEAHGYSAISQFGLLLDLNNQMFPIFNAANVSLVSGSETPLNLRFAKKDATAYEFDQEAVDALGIKSFLRLREFKNLKAGWSYGKGSAVSIESLENMELFLKTFGKTLVATFSFPLIFLNRDGELELSWKKGSHAEVFVRFHETDVDYLVSPADLEGTEATKDAGLSIHAAIRSELPA